MASGQQVLVGRLNKATNLPPLLRLLLGLALFEQSCSRVLVRGDVLLKRRVLVCHGGMVVRRVFWPKPRSYAACTRRYIPRSSMLPGACDHLRDLHARVSRLPASSLPALAAADGGQQAAMMMMTAGGLTSARHRRHRSPCPSRRSSRAEPTSWTKLMVSDGGRGEMWTDANCGREAAIAKREKSAKKLDKKGREAGGARAADGKRNWLSRQSQMCRALDGRIRGRWAARAVSRW